MSKKTLILIISMVSLIAVSTVVLVVAFSPKHTVDKEYQDNTSIIENTLAPKDDADINVESINGYTEREVSYLSLPYRVEDTDIEIISVGSYNGDVMLDDNKTKVENMFAIVVKNTGDRVVSYSNLTVDTGVGEYSFSPTNLPSGIASVVFPNSSQLKFDDVTKFEITSKLVVNSDNLSLLESKVGVKFEDGCFVLTNHTDENLGTVYIRYKNVSNGNAYLGGETYSVMQQNVEPYKTYKIPAENFDEEKSVIITVESVLDN